MAHSTSRLLVAGVAALLMLAPDSLVAQLRPLDPIDWSVFEPGNTLAVRIGVGTYWRQRASLIGVDGRLLELGDFSVLWRSDRVALEASGALLRLFDEGNVYAPPMPGTTPPPAPRRRDTGDYRVAAALRLTPGAGSVMATLRFGTRLPTTNNRVGLERDQTDFFALLGGRLRRAGFSASAEAGVSLNGTRRPENEQQDVLVYALTATYQHDWIAPSVTLVGQAAGAHAPRVRGTEDLSELRVGLQVGQRHWIRVSLIKGLRDTSPRSGVTVYTGIVR